MSNEILIIMLTYFRPKGTTKQYLQRSIMSVINQTFTNWKLVIIGDKYEPKNELDNIINTFNNLTNKIIYLYNTNTERDFVDSTNKLHLWNCAGANAYNMGIDYGLNNKFKYFFTLDDDDYWNKNHLEEHMKIYRKYNDCIFVVTKSTYIKSVLPKENINIFRNNMLPRPCGMVHSSFSYRNDIIRFKHKSYDKNGSNYPGDADKLLKIHDFIKKSNGMFCSIYNPILTCNHEQEKDDY